MHLPFGVYVLPDTLTQGRTSNGKDTIDEYDDNLYDVLVPYVLDEDGAYDILQEYIHDRHAMEWIDD